MQKTLKRNKNVSTDTTFKANRTKGEIASNVIKHVIGIVLLVYSLTLLIPIFWMLLNSLKTEIEYYQTKTFDFPSKAYWQNYAYIFKNLQYTVNSRDGLGKVTYTLPWMFAYSLLWAVVHPLFNTLISVMCAYVISKYKFPGRNFIYSLGIIIMILPIVGSTASALVVRRELNIYNNMFLTIITSPSGAFSGMHFLMLYAAFKSIPWEYAEAVFIDGGGHFRVFITIMFPMIMPTFWVLVLLGFIASWNDYGTFLYWLPSYANIAIGVYKFQYTGRIQYGTTMPQILACFAIVSIPIVTLYVASQRVITANYMVGGLKG